MSRSVTIEGGRIRCDECGEPATSIDYSNRTSGWGASCADHQVGDYWIPIDAAAASQHGGDALLVEPFDWFVHLSFKQRSDSLAHWLGYEGARVLDRMLKRKS